MENLLMNLSSRRARHWNLLKIRASWGRVGNLGSIGYNYKSALLGKNYWSEQAQYGVESNKIWGNFVYNSTALNPNLTWETSEQWDLGLDVNMFDNRLSMAFDYFDKRTFNLIQSTNDELAGNDRYRCHVSQSRWSPQPRFWGANQLEPTGK